MKTLHTERSKYHSNIKNLKFIRWGSLNPVKQKGYNASGDGYHAPPARKGLYAFPYPYIEPFLLGSTDFIPDRHEWVRRSDGSIVNDKDPDADEWEKRTKGEVQFKKLPAKGKVKGFINKQKQISDAFENGKIDKETFDKEMDKAEKEEEERHDKGWFLAKLKPPKKFIHVGEIWHHLKENVKQSDILDSHGGWILTNIDVYKKLLSKEIGSIKKATARDGIGTTMDHLEVFIERPVSNMRESVGEVSGMRDIIKGILNEVEIRDIRKKQQKANTYTQRKNKHKKSVKYNPKRSKEVTKKGVGRRNTSKTADARRILAKKHGIKRAEEKIENKFVMDYTEVGELMQKHGYKYDRNVANWTNKKIGLDPDKRKRKKKQWDDYEGAKKDKKVDKKVINVKSSSEGGKNDTSLPAEINIDTNVTKDFDDVEIGQLEYGIIDDSEITEDDIMNYVGRLILYIIHGDERSVEFVYDDMEEDFQGKVPMVSSEAVLEDITDKGYIWDRDGQTWKSSSGEFPITGEKDENEKSILGRAFATAAFSDYKYLTITGDDNFSISRDNVYKDLSGVGFDWDTEEKIWAEIEEKQEEVQ